MNVKKCWKSVKFHYVFLPKEEGCSSSSSTTSSVVNWSFRFNDDAGCFPPRVPADVGFFLGFFGAGGWGMLSSLLALTGVAVSGGSLLSHWLSSSATFALTIAS